MPNTGNPKTLPSSDENVLENRDDERDIILDQDQTALTSPQHSDENLGAFGMDTPPLAEDPRFIRGELDVKEQMDRVIRALNKAVGGDPEHDILPDEEIIR